MIPGTDQLVLDPAGSSAAAAVAAAAECAACGVPGEVAFAGVGADVMLWVVPGTEQGAVREAVGSERTVAIAPGQTAGEMSALVAVAGEPAPGATAWTAGADGPAETAAGITVLGS